MADPGAGEANTASIGMVKTFKIRLPVRSSGPPSCRGTSYKNTFCL
jgi:hypothetical protein